MPFPTLHKSTRHREYDAYSAKERANVVYEYLFVGRSHRWLDTHVLDKDAVTSLGWQSMGILHYLGLVNPHKAYFKGKTITDAIEMLQAEDSVYYADIINYLSIYSKP